MIAGLRSAAAAAAGVLALFACLVTVAPERIGGVSPVNLLVALVSISATAACLGAVSKTEGRSRDVWWLFTAATGAFSAGHVLVAVGPLLGDGAGLAVTARTAYLISRALAILATVAILMLAKGWARRSRGLMDALVVACALTFVGWPTLLQETVPAAARTGAVGSILPALGPMGDLVVLAGLLAALARARLNARLTLALLALAPGAALAAQVLGAGAGPSRVLMLQGGVVVARLAVAIAALSPGRDLFGEVGDDSVGRFGLTLPYVPAIVAVAAAAWMFLGSGSLTRFAFWTLIALMVLVLARQFLTLLENQSMALHLEATVDERTSTLREREAQLRHQVLHDPLTGLANRRLLRERIDQALLRSRRTSEPLTMLLLDIDDFKTVNDSLGHLAGDLLLTQIARRITDCFDAQATCARLGGDEFAVILEGTNAADAQMFSRRLLVILDEPFVIEGRQLRAGASIGIACSDGRETTGELIRNADLALYRAKASGKRRSALFEEDMHERMVDRLELGNDLRDAVDDDQLFLLYQPLVDLTTDRITGVESLVRWRHPRRGVIPPGEFVELAEDEGTVVEIGAWVLQESCRQVKLWDDVEKLRVQVNVSPRQLQEPGLISLVRRTLHETELEPWRLVLEITESALVADLPVVGATLAELRAMGVMIALDDFGTGSSSLSHLRRFPVGMLKVDKSFTDGLGGRNGEGRLAAAVLHMAQTLGLETVCEGIEREEQLEAARALGCSLGQGYLLAKPLDPFSVGQLLRTTEAEAVAAAGGWF